MGAAGAGPAGAGAVGLAIGPGGAGAVGSPAAGGAPAKSPAKAAARNDRRVILGFSALLVE
jgi:hypothetical protein